MFTSQEERERALVWMCGDQVAVECLNILARLTQVVDDLVDEQVSVDQRATWAVEVYDLFLVQLPMNPFWRANQTGLTFVMMNGVFEWDCSNDWQLSSDVDQHAFGFVRREAMDAVITMAAYLVGGREHARHVAREVNLFYHVTHAEDENVQTWVKEAAS